jgi:dihydrolipoamide dehydrogenase
MDSYDLVIIGAGPGGYVCAIRAAQLGLQVALVEKEPTLGGTCLNVGCIPSKALLESSELLAAARDHFQDHGISTGQVSIDIAQMMTRKERIVDELTSGIADLMKKRKVTVLQGHGELTAANRVKVTNGEGAIEVEAGNVVLATGSVPVELPFMRFNRASIISSTEALALSEVPAHLIVIGAGAVGLELGSVWRRLGAKVTVVEMLPSITPFADKQMANNLKRALGEQGLEILLSSKVTSAEVSDRTVTVTVEDKKGEQQQLTCDKVLVAVGRKPYSDGLGLDAVGVTTDRLGRVEVNDQLQTSVSGIYAIGDLVRGPMLAHKAEDEGMVVAEIIAGQPGHLSYEMIPSVVYTDPELAGVGRTEAELKEAKVPFTAGRFLFGANGRAKSLGQEHGMVKILAHKETGKILGVHMVGPRVSELIAEAVVAMEHGATADNLARTVHAHPTLSEVVREAALAVDKRAIHA